MLLISKQFKEGQEAWDIYYNSLWVIKSENPYKKYSEDWKIWNKGWNTNFKGV